MELLSPSQTGQWDAFTCRQQQISSAELMERAASACLHWLQSRDYILAAFTVICGKGNNGGDGLALARLLAQQNRPVTVYVLDTDTSGSADFEVNVKRLQQANVPVTTINGGTSMPVIKNDAVVIDALFGSGLNRPLEGLAAQLVEHMNRSGAKIISLDMPSGMFATRTSKNNTVVKATCTLSFQVQKLAFMMPENEQYAAEVHVLDIGLDPAFPETVACMMETIDAAMISILYRPRKAFSHKGSFGHALLVAGSLGKMGACQLSARACLRAGTGLLTCFAPGCGYTVLQTSVPEAMVITAEQKNFISSIPSDLSKYNAVGAGPGLGTEKATTDALKKLMEGYRQPMVLDADALNCIAAAPELLATIPAFSILTPHPKEFERLFGSSENDFDRTSLALQKAKELSVIIVLKGHHTFIAMPGGKGYFNTTGNAGMATGGSGDVLTGLLTGILAQKYSPASAALMGVYLHGLSGDLAAAQLSQEALIASDLVDYIGAGYKLIGSRKTP